MTERRRTVVVLGALAVWTTALLARAVQRVVEGDSMAPTLQPGQRVLVRPPWRLRRGDVVVVRLGEVTSLKRVVGLPGERVALSGGRLVVDGEVVAEPYVARRSSDAAWTVPVDHVVVLGDHRGRSTDSRLHGPVARSRVRAVAWARLGPRPALLPMTRPHPAPPRSR